MIDTAYGFSPEIAMLLPEANLAAGHIPMAELLKIEEALSATPGSILFSGPSGGAFTAAAAAAIFSSHVEYHGSSGKQAALFGKAAREAGFKVINSPVSDAPAGRFISFIPERIGPYANPGAALLFTGEHMPVLKQGDLPFFEGFLLSRLRENLSVSCGTCAVDLASPGAAVKLHDILDRISHDNRLILFGNRSESEHFFQTPLENVHDVGTPMRKALRSFCSGGNIFLLKMGADGAWLFQADHTGLRGIYIPPVPVREIHSVNAGDMFAGAYLGGIASGLSPENAAAAAAEAGAAAVSRPGNRLSKETILHVRSMLKGNRHAGGY
jgi:sugar/nucleoside kinase (ribokinase family)